MQMGLSMVSVVNSGARTSHFSRKASAEAMGKPVPSSLGTILNWLVMAVTESR